MATASGRRECKASLIEVLLCELGGDRRAGDLFQKFLRSTNYSRQLALLLIDVARGNDRDSWEVRRLATLMLQEHLLAVDANDTLEFNFILRQLGLKKGRGEQGRVVKSVLSEGYTTRDFAPFVAEFRQRLKRPRCAVRPCSKKRTTVEDVRQFAHQSRQECRLVLARYMFSPDEVVERICGMVKIRTGSPLELEDGVSQEEARNAIVDLPDYEATILKKLLPEDPVFWVAEQTPSRLNSLIEYPLGTVVLVVKPPGSHYEFEFKRAGRRGLHPLSARSHVPPSHRLDGGSMLSALQYEAAQVAVFGNVFRRIHGRSAPLSRIVSLVSKHDVPLRKGNRNIFDYFNDPEIYGQGFDKMRKAMAIVVRCFREERGNVAPSLPGDFGLTVQFISFAGPTQATICGSSSFRLDLLAKYLGPDGPNEYFTRGLQVDYSTQDARQFADEVLDEVLGIYKPPNAEYENHQQYVNAALARPKNRARARAIYLELHEQIGRFWGTLLGMRGYSFGESFVARNVGLRTIWSQGKWRVRLIFQDHDNLVLPTRGQKDFWPATALPANRLDDCFIGQLDDERLVCQLNCLRQIYGADDALHKKGRKRLRKAMKRAYVQTHRAISVDPKVRSRFNDRFVERLRDWDAVARKYVSGNGSSNGQAWKARVSKFLKKRRYTDRLIADHIKALDKYGAFVERNSFLYCAKIDDQ